MSVISKSKLHVNTWDYHINSARLVNHCCCDNSRDIAYREWSGLLSFIIIFKSEVWTVSPNGKHVM